jgi:hypothetical protein
MSRGLSSSAKTESQKSFNSLVTLVEIVVDSGNPTYLTDYARDLVDDSKTYLSAQGVLGITNILEDSSNSIQKVDLTLTAIPDGFVNLFLDHDYIDRPVKVRKLFVDTSTGASIGSSILVFDGRIDKPIINHEFDSRTATIGISASSHWVDFQRKNGRHTNDAEQQSLFSGDECFQFAIDFDKEITWGQAN